MTWTSIFSSTTFWLVLLALTVFGYGVIRTSPLGRLPLFNNKRTLTIVAILGFVFASGWLSLGMFSTGSLATAQAWSVTDVQISSLSPSAAGGTVAVDSNNPYLINARYTDAQANLTTGIYEINTSTFTVIRSGTNLPAGSCTVSVVSSDFYGNEVTGVVSATPYNILEKDVAGRFKTYLSAGTDVATTSDLQQSMPLAFTEGDADASFTMIANVDETSHDALNQYSSRDVTLNVCGFPVVVRVFTM